MNLRNYIESVKGRERMKKACLDELPVYLCESVMR
jgi:hypothetical protein